MSKWFQERKEVLARISALEEQLEKLVAAVQAGDGTETQPPVTTDDSTTDPPDDTTTVPQPDPLESAWSAIFSGSTGVQIAIVSPKQKGYKGGPFVVEDNKDHIKGEGDSVEAALANYLELGGKHTGAPGSLPDSEMEQARFFATRGNVTAPTSCRHSGDGYVCDYYRGQTSKTGAFQTTAKAIKELRRVLGNKI